MTWTSIIALSSAELCWVTQASFHLSQGSVSGPYLHTIGKCCLERPSQSRDQWTNCIFECDVVLLFLCHACRGSTRVWSRGARWLLSSTCEVFMMPYFSWTVAYVGLFWRLKGWAKMRCGFLPQCLCLCVLESLLVPSKRQQEHHPLHYQAHFNPKRVRAEHNQSFVFVKCKTWRCSGFDWEIFWPVWPFQHRPVVCQWSHWQFVGRTAGMNMDTLPWPWDGREAVWQACHTCLGCQKHGLRSTKSCAPRGGILLCLILVLSLMISAYLIKRYPKNVIYLFLPLRILNL